jgi:hypothetical protein
MSLWSALVVSLPLRLPRLTGNLRGKWRRRRRHVDEQLRPGVPDRMRGAGRHENHRALAHRASLVTDQHLAVAADDDIDLLLGRVTVQRLLAARLAFHPGHAQAPSAELALGQQQVRHLAITALVAGTARKCLNVHGAIIAERCAQGDRTSARRRPAWKIGHRPPGVTCQYVGAGQEASDDPWPTVSVR